MTTVLIGTNRLEECEHVVSIGDVSLLDATIDDGCPLVTLSLTRGQGTVDFQITGNVVQKGALETRSMGDRFEVFQGSVVVLQAWIADESLLHLVVDFRPLGLNFHSDEHALYVGGATLSGNVFRRCKTAISLTSPLTD